MKALLILLIVVYMISSPQILNAKEVLSLAGEWRIKLDPKDVGAAEKWYNQKFDDKIQLPGLLQAQGYGVEPSINTPWIGGSGVEKFELPHYAKYEKYLKDENYKHPFWLTPEKYYRGAAWYQKKIYIPNEWRDKRIVLTLERCHWETTVFVGGIKVGSDSSLSTTHTYDLSKVAQPGEHTLSIRVDNDMIINVGQNAHSVSDHTQSNWNGIVGDILLTASSPVFIEHVDIYPDAQVKAAKAIVNIGSVNARQASARLSLSAECDGLKLPVIEKQIQQNENSIVIDYPLGDDVKLWDEFHPKLYSMNVRLHSVNYVDEKTISFGVRDFKPVGTRFCVNDRPIFLRGTLDCCIFPKTGHPPMQPDEWRRIFTTLKQHGLNHMRFHSWCPPKAAFVAADEAGFYLQVEGPFWVNQGATLGNGEEIDSFIYREIERILESYGNHPSFVMFAHGNEPAGENQRKYLGDLVEYLKSKDSRRLYTSAAAWPLIPESDFHVSPAPRIQGWGQGLKSIINGEPPRSDYDWRDFVNKQDRPVVSHEIGQWCVYPNFDEMKKYTGHLKPKNFEIFYDLLKRNHMADQAHDFLMASGKLQALCYKADIEAALRTPGFAGFQLLDIHDFPGQGTALIGVLDPFYESKPYISPQEFNRFCGLTVPLARLDKRSFSTVEEFNAKLEVSHFGEAPIENADITWIVKDQNGGIVKHGGATKTIAVDNAQHMGNVEFSLASLAAPQKLTLVVKIAGYGENSWDFWLYPEAANADKGDVLVVDELTKRTIRKLKNGATVLLNLNGKVLPEKGGDVAIGFSSIFWNTAWTSDQPPHTLGILCNPDHALFDSFPTEYHSNWQWWDIVSSSQAMILDDFPAELRPHIQPIDSWFYARRLGLLFEAKVDAGKLMVTSINFSNLENRLPARQLYFSLLKYMNSEAFQPIIQVNVRSITDFY